MVTAPLNEVTEKVNLGQGKQSVVVITTPLNGMFDRVILGHVLNGLSEHIRTEIKVLGPHDLDQAMKWAIKLEDKESPRLQRSVTTRNPAPMAISPLFTFSFISLPINLFAPKVKLMLLMLTCMKLRCFSFHINHITQILPQIVSNCLAQTLSIVANFIERDYASSAVHATNCTIVTQFHIHNEKPNHSFENEAHYVLLMRLQNTIEEVHAIKAHNVYYLPKCTEFQVQNHMLEIDLRSVVGEEFLFVEKDSGNTNRIFDKRCSKLL